MVKRWHVPPVIGKIESGVPTVEIVLASDYDALDAALDECIANCADPRDKRRIRELEADNARHKSAVLALLGRVRKLEVALEVIASGTICPDLFPDAVRTEQDYELAAKTAMVTAIAALERGAEHE
jgi:hypothetical protein